MKNILLSVLLLTMSVALFAQTYGDKEFYLIDSIDLETVSEYDKGVLDKYLTNYRNATSDTAAIAQLGTLIEECWDESIWPRYNLHVRQFTDELLKTESNEEVRKKLLYYNASSYGNEGWLYSQSGNYDKEQECYLKALELFKEAESNEGIGQIYNFLGTVADAQGDVLKGLDYMQKALELAISINDVKGMMSGHHNIGAAHLVISNMEIAKYNYHQTIKHARTSSDLTFEGLANIGLAFISYHQDDLDSALLKANYGMQLLKESGAENQGAFGYDILGKIFLSKQKPDSALKYFRKQAALSLGDGQNSNTSIAYAGLGATYLQLANYDSSLFYAKQSYSIAGRIKNASDISKGPKVLKDVYKRLNQPDSALKYANIYYESTINKLSEETTKRLFQQNEKHKFDKQKEIDDLKHEQEIALERAAKQRNASIMYSALVIILVLAIASVFIYKQLKTIETQKTELASAYEQLEESKKSELIASNLKALQSQMNPHFIFNALNSVQDLVLLQDIRSSNKFLGKFSDLIRKILLSSQKQFIPLQEEIETLQLYLDLETLRFGEDFHSQIDLGVSESTLDQMIPAMFIQPFAENAMKHGLFHKKGEKKLIIEFTENDLELVCRITDNGIGTEAANKIKQRQNQLHTGFSTKAINDRIDLLNQKLDRKIKLQQNDLKESGQVMGHQVIIVFPKDLG